MRSIAYNVETAIVALRATTREMGWKRVDVANAIRWQENMLGWDYFGAHFACEEHGRDSLDYVVWMPVCKSQSGTEGCAVHLFSVQTDEVHMRRFLKHEKSFWCFALEERLQGDMFDHIPTITDEDELISILSGLMALRYSSIFR